MRRRDLAGLALAATSAPLLARAQGTQQQPQGGGGGGAEERLVLELKDGPVTIQLLPEVAPRHVERIKTLTGRGFYNGVPFHRVIEGFMAQTGDPTGTGTGGSDLPDLPAEFTNRYRFIRGTCGMARTSAPNSANSQFFIMFAPGPSLDNQYTIWGRVVAGMEAVDKIKRGSGGSGLVQNSERVIRARIANA